MANSRLAAFLEMGKIVTVHGIKGEVKIQPWCDDACLFCEFDKLYLDKNGNDAVKINSARVQKNMVIAKLGGIDTVEQAQKMRNRILYADRKELVLEENTYFICDLLGMEVINADTGKSYGKIYDVISTGANDVYCSKLEDKEYLFPALPQVVIQTDIEKGVMSIRPLKGLFDDED